MITFWMEDMEDVGYLLMMEDGAPYHRGVASQRRKELEEVGWIGWGPLTWPANSPDLNPIENLWHVLKSNIRKRRDIPSSRNQLIAALQEEWAKIDMDIVNHLIDTMPHRMRAVVEARDGTTKY